MKFKISVLIVICFCLFFGCKEQAIPKPKAQIRLEYPPGNLLPLETDNFKFQYNQLAKAKLNTENAFSLEYPEMKGAIFLSYKKVDGNLEKLIVDAKRLSYEHA